MVRNFLSLVFLFSLFIAQAASARAVHAGGGQIPVIDPGDFGNPAGNPGREQEADTDPLAAAAKAIKEESSGVYGDLAEIKDDDNTETALKKMSDSIKTKTSGLTGAEKAKVEEKLYGLLGTWAKEKFKDKEGNKAAEALDLRSKETGFLKRNLANLKKKEGRSAEENKQLAEMEKEVDRRAAEDVIDKNKKEVPKAEEKIAEFEKNAVKTDLDSKTIQDLKKPEFAKFMKEYAEANGFTDKAKAKLAEYQAAAEASSKIDSLIPGSDSSERVAKLYSGSARELPSMLSDLRTAAGAKGEEAVNALGGLAGNSKPLKAAIDMHNLEAKQGGQGDLVKQYQDLQKKEADAEKIAQNSRFPMLTRIGQKLFNGTHDEDVKNEALRNQYNHSVDATVKAKAGVDPSTLDANARKAAEKAYNYAADHGTNQIPYPRGLENSQFAELKALAGGSKEQRAATVSAIADSLADGKKDYRAQIKAMGVEKGLFGKEVEEEIAAAVKARQDRDRANFETNFPAVIEKAGLPKDTHLTDAGKKWLTDVYTHLPGDKAREDALKAFAARVGFDKDDNHTVQALIKHGNLTDGEKDFLRQESRKSYQTAAAQQPKAGEIQKLYDESANEVHRFVPNNGNGSDVVAAHPSYHEDLKNGSPFDPGKLTFEDPRDHSKHTGASYGYYAGGEMWIRMKDSNCVWITGQGVRCDLH